MQSGSAADDSDVNAAIAKIGEAHDIEKIGFCAADVFTEVREALHERKAAGLSADMAFTYRNPDRSTDPSRTLENAQSIIVGARSYRRSLEGAAGESSSSGKPAGAGRAEIAEYVWEPPLRRAANRIASNRPVPRRRRLAGPGADR